MTKFKPLYDIADAVRNKIADLGQFESVRVAAISNSGQIWLAKDVLSSLPAAIVCIGSSDFESFGLVREKSVLVIVIDTFKGGTEARAEGIWPLVDSVCASFMPQVAEGEVPEMPVIDGVEYELKRFSPLDSGERVVAFAIEVSAREAAQYETEST